MDQRGKSSGEDDATELSSFPLKPGAARAEPAGVQLGQFMAAAGITQANRELVADQLATAAGEARTVLLATVGRKTSDSAALRRDAEPDRAATYTEGIGGSWSRRQRHPSISWLG